MPKWTQIRCTLQGSNPVIWREVRVPADLKLYRLHKALQCLFGWQDYHLHEFVCAGESYTHPELMDDEWSEGYHDETQVRLGDLGDEILYRYDLGDDWEVGIQVVGRGTADPALPEVLAGEHPGPPEDCGGIGGLEELNRVLRDRKDPEYQEMRSWARSYHPDKFSLDRLRSRWARLFPAPRPKITPTSSLPLDFRPRALPLESYKLARLNAKVAMVAALLERGEPLSIESLVQRLLSAGYPLAHGPTSLTKSWRRDPILRLRRDGRLEIYRDHPEMWRYAMELEEAAQREDSPEWASTPLEPAELTRGFKNHTTLNRAQVLISVLDSLGSTASLSQLTGALENLGKAFSLTQVLLKKDLPISRSGDLLHLDPMADSLRQTRLVVRRSLHRMGRFQARSEQVLPQQRQLLWWRSGVAVVRDLHNGQDETLDADRLRKFLRSAEWIFAPHILELYEELGLQAPRETYLFDLMPLEFFDNQRLYPVATGFEDFLRCTVPGPAPEIERLQQFYEFGELHGEVLGPHGATPVWWDFRPGPSGSRPRTRLFSVEIPD